MKLFSLPENQADRRPWGVFICLFFGIGYVITTELLFPLMNSIFAPSVTLPTTASEYIMGLFIAPAVVWMTSRGVEKTVKTVKGAPE